MGCMGNITPTTRYENERNRIEDASGDSITADEATAILDVLDNMEGRRENSTLVTYGNKLRMFAQDTEPSIAEADPPVLIDMMDEFCEERDYSDGSINQAQSALIAYVKYHHNDDAADEINLKRDNSGPSIDPRTVLTPDEFHEMRDAAPKMRDRAMIDLFGYTGQRLRVVQNLKIGDVDPEAGVWYMPDAEGLKGADRVGNKRPLLGAQDSVKDWLQMHPTGDPDDYFITCSTDNRSEYGDRLGGDAIRRQLRRVAKRAGIDKPVNPHAFRHYFVTVAKVQYDMDDATIKHLLGHSPSSNIMETTYAHLSDDDHIDAAREAMGFDTDDEEPHSLAPPVCPTCATPLKPDAEACPTPTCREVFTPDAGPTPDDAVRSHYREADDMDTVEKLQRLDELLDDPEVRKMMAEKET